MQDDTKHTPGPLRARRDTYWPFSIRLLDANGETLDLWCSHANSTEQHSLSDFNQGVGFKGAEREAAIIANERQFANATLWAASPALLAVLQRLLCTFDGYWIQEAGEFWTQAREAVAAALGTPPPADSRSTPIPADCRTPNLE